MERKFVGRYGIGLGLLLTIGSAFASGVLKPTAASAIIIDANSGRVLWQKNADTPRYPASTTKILTALLLIEHTKPDDIITAPPDILKVGQSSMHLQPGEKVTAHDLLYALLLRSANDGCVAVADHISGSVPAFADLMNQRAKEIGCTGSHFDNPNGLNDTHHWVTAADLAKIARVAMTYPAFREAVSSERYKITRSINQHDSWMVNRDKLLRTDPTEDGIKTGWTVPAGHCFVGSATRNGYRIITVVLKSNDWKKETGQMLNWAFDTHSLVPIASAEAKLPNLELAGPTGNSISIPVKLAAPVSACLDKGVPAPVLTTKLKPEPGLSGSIATGQQVGEADFVDAAGTVYAVAPIFSTSDVTADALASSSARPNSRLAGLFIPKWGWVTGFLVIGGVGLKRATTKKKRYGSFTRPRIWL